MAFANLHRTHFWSNSMRPAADLIVGTIANARRNLLISKMSAADYLAVLERQKLKRFVARIVPHRSDL